MSFKSTFIVHYSHTIIRAYNAHGCIVINISHLYIKVDEIIYEQIQIQV